MGRIWGYYLMRGMEALTEKVVLPCYAKKNKKIWWCFRVPHPDQLRRTSPDSDHIKLLFLNLAKICMLSLAHYCQRRCSYRKKQLIRCQRSQKASLHFAAHLSSGGHLQIRKFPFPNLDLILYRLRLTFHIQTLIRNDFWTNEAGSLPGRSAVSRRVCCHEIIVSWSKGTRWWRLWGLFRTLRHLQWTPTCKDQNSCFESVN